MTDAAYVSVIAWPELMPEEDRIGLIEQAIGLDRFLSEQAVRRSVPSVLRRMDLPDARDALATLRRASAVAFGPKQSAFDERADFHAAKRLISGSGTSFLAEAWRGDPVVFDAANIAVLIRASLRTTEMRAVDQGGPGVATSLINTSGRHLRDVASDIADEVEQVSAARQTRVNLTEVLDIHLADGSRIRLNGDKFGFDVLGDKRGYTDKQNMDKLAVLLSERAPQAVVDLNFRSFRVPADIQTHLARSHRGRVRKRVETPAFEFYSVWAALMYRHLATP
jgi:hypothetical protein